MFHLHKIQLSNYNLGRYLLNNTCVRSIDAWDETIPPKAG